MQDLHAALSRALAAQGRCALVTLAEVKGSAPRESGAKMVVWPDGFAGSIGGGRLEFTALAEARRLLAAGGAAPPRLERVALGPSLGQCCGGAASLLMEIVEASALGWLEPLRQAEAEGRPALLVSALDGGAVAKSLVEPAGLAGAALPDGLLAKARALLVDDLARRRIERAETGGRYLFEPLARPEPALFLFGAGHVGRALAAVLAGLPFRSHWIDEREDIFPAEPPTGLTLVPATAPAELVEAAPGGSFYLVMTHSHARDLEICERVLQRGDFAYLGLIGSASKRARFERRFRDLGLEEACIARLTCPIGIAGIGGKSPPEIAVAVAAELLQRREAMGRARDPALPRVRASG